MQTWSDVQLLCWADPVRQDISFNCQDINLSYQDINLNWVVRVRTTVQLSPGWDGLSRFRRRRQRPCQGARRGREQGGRVKSGRETRNF